MTNGERFRKWLTDEQVAKMIGKCVDCYDCPVLPTVLHDEMCSAEFEDEEPPECWEIIAKWFGMEAEE